MKRADAARTGAAKLMEVESALDNALRHAAELVGLLPALRQNVGLSAVVGQAAFDDLGETIGHIITARRTLVRAHGNLQTVRRQIGCGALAMGVLDKPGDGDGPRTTGLLVVGSEAA